MTTNFLAKKEKVIVMQIIETYVPITQANAKLLDMVRQLGDTNDCYHKKRCTSGSTVIYEKI
jgi:hypothetical protein